MLKIKKRATFTRLAFLLMLTAPLHGFAQNMSFSEVTRYDMRNQLHEDEFTLISLGDRQVPILIMESEQVITKGVVFIIGDADMAFGRTNSLTQVADALPAIGWATVTMPSLGLSQVSNVVLPIPENKDEQTENKQAEADVQDDIPVSNTETETETEAAPAPDLLESSVSEITSETTIANSRSQVGGISEADLVIYSLEIAAYLESAFEHMQATMGHRIVISQGITAATIMKLSAEGNEAAKNIDAIIINNPYWPIRKLNNKIPMIVAQTPMPLLDLISAQDNNWSKQTQSKRKTKAMTELKEIYRQSEVVGQTLDQAQMEYIARLLKGWTTYLGW